MGLRMHRKISASLTWRSGLRLDMGTLLGDSSNFLPGYTRARFTIGIFTRRIHTQFSFYPISTKDSGSESPASIVEKSIPQTLQFTTFVTTVDPEKRTISSIEIDLDHCSAG